MIEIGSNLGFAIMVVGIAFAIALTQILKRK